MSSKGKKFSQTQENNGLDSDFAIALIDTFKASGMKPKVVAKKLGLQSGTIYNTLTLSRKYVPGLVMTNCMVDTFEEHKPGSRIFFGLRIAGVPLKAAYRAAFIEEERNSFVFEPKTISEAPEKDQLTDLISETLPQVPLEELVPKIDDEKILELIVCCIKANPNLIDNLIENLEIEDVAQFIFACSSKEDLRQYMRNQDVNYSRTMTELVSTCLDSGADAQIVGESMDSRTFGRIALGFSYALRAKPDVKDTDLKTLQAESMLQGEPAIKMSRKRKSIEIENKVEAEAEY